MIVRTERGQRLLELAREKGVLECKDVPETGLDKLRRASAGKKRTGVRNLREKAGDLGYLEPSAALFQDL